MRHPRQKSRLFARLAALALSVTALLSVLAVSAAALEPTTITVELRPSVTIVVDDVARTFYDVTGKEVHPIYYNGTHYLPVRAIGELMGKNVNWDGNTKTISLTSPRTTTPTPGTPDTTAQDQKISVQMRPDFTIVVDGVQRTFTDAKGNAVYPILNSGSNYLPVRAIGELMGKEVSWNGATKTVTLSGGGLVTDADSFDPASGTSNPQPGTSTPSGGTGSYIGEERAKQIALTHAGLTSSQVTFVRAYLERDDGRWQYDVEFYTKDYKEYDYEIDAATGAVLSFDYDADYYTPPASTSSGTMISLETAKSKALANAGLTAGQVTFVKAKLDWDDGRQTYEIEFRHGTTEYEYEIDAYSGAVLSKDVDSIYD